MPYEGYRFSDSISSLYHVRIAINQADVFTEHLKDLVRQRTGEYIAKRTINNLMNGKTQRPQMRTVELIMRALGYQMKWEREQ